MTGSGDRLRRVGRALRVLAGVLVAILAVAAPVAGARWWQTVLGSAPVVRDQVLVTDDAAVRIPEAVRAFATDPAIDARTRGAVLVLAYHDITPEPEGRYDVTPRALRAQLAMLREAGFESVSLDALVRARTDPAALPRRSVVITFDDGTGGVWRYADPLLAEFGFRGAAFVITGRLGTHHPYYLTWPEVTALARSDRWDIGSHTADSHELGDVGGGRRWPMLINRLVGSDGVLETSEQARLRVTADTHASITAITGHDLPRPVAFAFPYSAALRPTNDPAVAAHSRQILTAAFPLLFTNDGDRRWLDATDLATGLLPRIGVQRSTTAAELFDTITRGMPAPPPGSADPLDRAAWSGTGDTAVVDGDRLRIRAADSAGTTVFYAYGRSRTWRDYRVSGTWTLQRGGYSALLLRAGGPGALRITIGASTLSVYAADGRHLAQLPLLDGLRHDVVAEIRGGTLTLTTDGFVHPPLPVPDPGAVGGGIGLRVGAAPNETVVEGLTISP